MEVYHLGHLKYADQLTGEGARLNGGRWNHLGIPCIYASETRALALLEYAANVPLELMPPSLAFTSYAIPEDSWKMFLSDELPEDWSQTPAPLSTKNFGSYHLNENVFLALKLPSVIIQSEFNFVINPLHPQFKKVRIKEVVPFTFDSRIKQ